MAIWHHLNWPGVTITMTYFRKKDIFHKDGYLRTAASFCSWKSFPMKKEETWISVYSDQNFLYKFFESQKMVLFFVNRSKFWMYLEKVFMITAMQQFTLAHDTFRNKRISFSFCSSGSLIEVMYDKIVFFLTLSKWNHLTRFQSLSN